MEPLLQWSRCYNKSRCYNGAVAINGIGHSTMEALLQWNGAVATIYNGIGYNTMEPLLQWNGAVATIYNGIGYSTIQWRLFMLAVQHQYNGVDLCWHEIGICA